MDWKTLKTVVAPALAVGVCLTSATAAQANPAREMTKPVPHSDKTQRLNDGRVVKVGEKVALKFNIPRASAAANRLVRCDEAAKGDQFDISMTLDFIKDTSNPQSHYLEPDQEVELTVRGERQISGSVTLGAEADAGAVLVRAAASVDTQIGASFTTSREFKLKDANTSDRGYFVVVGAKAWRIKGEKYWYDGACNYHSVKTEAVHPITDNISLGRSYPQ